MIRVTGNNFGATSIRLNEYLSPEICVLNGRISIDPSNADFRAATVLEIYVADLPIEKSAKAFLYFVTNERGARYCDSSAVPVETWIKDKNTICIERLTEWDNQGELYIFMQTGYIPNRIREATTRLGYERLEIRSSDFDQQANYRSYFETDRWIYVYIEFTRFLHTTAGQDGGLVFGNLSMFGSSEFPLISTDVAGAIMGNACTICEVWASDLHCNGVSEAWIAASSGALMTGFFLKIF